MNENGKVDDGVYCAGWIATGPTGVIVDTMTSSFQVARTILADIESGRVSGTKSGFDGVRDILRIEHRIVTFPDWEKIDTMERELGRTEGKPREKIMDVSAMMILL